MPVELAGVVEPLNALIQERVPMAVLVRELALRSDALCGALRPWFGSRSAAQLMTLKLGNLLVAKHDYLARNATVAGHPIGLAIDPSNGCNLRCPGCVHSSNEAWSSIYDWPSGSMPERRMRSVLDQYAPYALQMALFNYGEPLINRKTPQFVRLAKSYLVLTSISTNLSVPKFDAEAYVRSGLDHMTLSIDGATDATYREYRRGGNLDLVLENLRALVEAKRRLGRHTPILNWQFLTFAHNLHELPRALEIAEEIGVDQLTAATPFSVACDDPTIVSAETPRQVHLFSQEASRHVRENFDPFPDERSQEWVEELYRRGWSAPAERLSSNEERRSRPTCQWLYKNMLVDAGGRVMPCCAAPGWDYDIVFSQIDDGVELSHFNSDKYEAARLGFVDPKGYAEKLESTDPPHCQNCTWNQSEVNITTEMIANHLATISHEAFAPILDSLCAW